MRYYDNTLTEKGTLSILLLYCLESMNERKGFTTFFQNIPKDAFFCGDLRIHKTCFSPIILCQHEITENVGLFRT